MLMVANNALILLSVLIHVLDPVSAEVYTSMAVIKKMVKNEKNILLDVANNIPKTVRESHNFVKFYQERLAKFATRNLTLEIAALQHPNAAFLVLQEFSRNYGKLIASASDSQKSKMKHYNLIASDVDIVGAAFALLLLQEAYNLNPRNMIEGKYFNISGPRLSYSDAFLIGHDAFKYKKYHYSIQWLELSADRRSIQSKNKKTRTDPNDVSLSRIFAVLGRALLRVGEKTKAEHIYRTWRMKGPDEEEIKTLERELKNDPVRDTVRVATEIKDLYRLCATHGSQPKAPLNPLLRCRYRGRVPYFRYQEEILHATPYISVFYDVITDSEIRKIKLMSISKMSRTEVSTPTGLLPSYSRTSQGAFLDDSASDTIMRVSRRVSYVTGLNASVSQRGFLSPSMSSGEPMQVVNYGIAGHFSIHRDPLEFSNRQTERVYAYSGLRIATFLIYLNDVTVGGYTVFPQLDLIVRPKKGSAMFWYNFNPAGEQEEKIWHAGCPVVIGEKWVINKWILSYGNTFLRRCGRSKEATQLDIDEDMIGGYR